MKVFLSWSGNRSKFIAETLREWLPKTIHAIEPWMSDEDIAAGARGLSEISSELKETNVGILCVVPENQNAPWLVFEAGALSKALGEALICPLLYDMKPSQVTGPLSQFQAKVLDKTGILGILQTLNTSCKKALSEVNLKESLEMWWPKLNEILTAIPEADLEDVPLRSSDDMIQEILELSRVSSRIFQGNLIPRLSAVEQELINFETNFVTGVVGSSIKKERKQKEYIMREDALLFPKIIKAFEQARAARIRDEKQD